MVSLILEEDIKVRHRKYLLNNNMKSRIESLKNNDFLTETEKIDKKLAKEIKSFYEFLANEYEMLVKEEDNIFLMEPEKLYEKILYIKKNYSILSKEFQLDRKILNKSLSNRILEILGYENFSHKELNSISKIKEDKVVDLYNYKKYRIANPDSWSAYDFVMTMGLKVCPYCNRNFITPLYAEKRKTRAAIDHFWPKKKYPYLSMSIYNMVPCCNTCNSSFKGERELTLETNINPYEDLSIESLYSFSYKVNQYEDFMGERNVDILLKYREGNDGERIKNNNDFFRIEKIYQYHSDVVNQLLQKKMVYDEYYIEYLLLKYDMFENKEEVVAFLTDDVEENELKNHILGKLRHDIIQELEF